MSLLKFLKDHTIVSVGKLTVDKCIVVEMIPDDPQKLIEFVLKNDCYILEIRWWDRASILQKSIIGYGGTPDPRDPQNYYFAETDICAYFEKTTTLSEYIKYLNDVKEQFITYDLYPAFDIYRK